MIVLDDPANPFFAHLFDPQDPERSLGSGARFLGAQIAVTNEPLSHEIEAILPWFADPAIPRSRKYLIVREIRTFERIRDIHSIRRISIRGAGRRPLHSYCRLPLLGTFRTCRPGCSTSVCSGRADIAVTRDYIRIRPFAIVGRAKFATWCLYQKPLSDRSK